MNKESNHDSEDLQEAIEKTKKKLKKGFANGLNKFKEHVDIGLEASKFKEMINEGDPEDIATSSQILGKSVIKGAREGLSDIVSGIAVGSNTLFKAFNKAKTTKEKKNQDDPLDGYEIIDEDE